jgi:hypothetical protein
VKPGAGQWGNIAACVHDRGSYIPIAAIYSPSIITMAGADYALLPSAEYLLLKPLAHQRALPIIVPRDQADYQLTMRRFGSARGNILASFNDPVLSECRNQAAGSAWRSLLETLGVRR